MSGSKSCASARKAPDDAVSSILTTQLKKCGFCEDNFERVGERRYRALIGVGNLSKSGHWGRWDDVESGEGESEYESVGELVSRPIRTGL